MLKDDRTIKRYSEAFKLQILSELESGRLTKNEIKRIYGISPSSIDSWIKKYGKFGLLNKRIKIETMDEIDKIKKLEEENKKLKELIVQKDIKNLLDEAYLDYAAERLGFKDADELKKKLNLK
ncbi:transposase [candidate division KSB1 bacterium]